MNEKCLKQKGAGTKLWIVLLNAIIDFFSLYPQVFYVSDLFKQKTKAPLPPPPIRREILSPVDIIDRNNHHNMV